MISLVSSLIIVYMCGLYNFEIFLIDLFLMLLVGEQIALFFAVLVPHYIIGMALVAGLYGFFMLVEGFMKIYSDIPVYLQWSYWTAIHTYSFRIFMTNEFEEIDELETGGQFTEGQDVLDFYDMEDFNADDDLVVMMVYFLLIFACTVLIMLWKYRTKLPNLRQGNRVAA